MRNKLSLEQRNQLIFWIGANKDRLTGLNLRQIAMEAIKSGQSTPSKDNLRKTLRTLGVEPVAMRREPLPPNNELGDRVTKLEQDWAGHLIPGVKVRIDDLEAELAKLRSELAEQATKTAVLRQLIYASGPYSQTAGSSVA